MIKLFSTALLIVAVMAGNASAATYYVKPDGSDGNSGLSPAQRFATVSYAVTQMVGGDTLYIAGDHRITDYIRPLAGTVNDRTAYVGWDGINANTKLQGGGMVTAGDTVKGLWTDRTGGVYSAAVPNGWTVAGVLIDDALHLDGGGGSSPGSGGFGQNGSTVYVNMDGSTSPSGKIVMVWPKLTIFRLDGTGTERSRDYISFWGLRLKYSAAAIGIYEARDCDYWTIERCTLMGANSTSAGSNTSLIRVTSSAGSDTSNVPHFWIIRKNSIAYSTDLNGNGHGSGISFYDYSDFLIDSNYFFGTFQGDCIEIKGQTASPITKYRMTIAYNIMDVDDARSGINCPWNHHVDARIYGNLIIGTDYGLRSGDGHNSNRSKRTWFYNNTIVNVQRGFTSGLDATSHAGYDHGIKYNVFYNCSEMGVRSNNDLKDGGGTHWFIDSNLYYNTDGSANFKLRYTTMSLATWQGLEGWDVNSLVNTRDPGFADTSSHTFAGYARPGAPTEMSRSDYGASPWSKYGAIQGSPTDPIIGLNTGSMNFSADQGGALPASQTFTITNLGPSTLNWSVSDNAAWLDVSPSSGNSNSADITVSVNTTSLSVGANVATITVSSSNATNSPQTISVTYTIASTSPLIWLSDSVLNFTAEQWSSPMPTSQTFTIKNVGAGTLNWSLSDDGDWLDLTPTAGISDSADITVSINTTDSSIGTHTATITVSSSNATNSPQTIAVNYIVTTSIPHIWLSTSSLGFTSVIDASVPSPKTFVIANTGGGTLDWTFSSDVSWLSFSDSSGIIDTATITASVDTSGLSVGTHNGTITVNSSTADNTPQTISVSYTITITPQAVSSLGSWTTGLSHTVASGVQRLLVLAIGWEDNSNGSDRPIGSISYGGIPMTQVVRQPVNSYQGVELWYLNEADIQRSSGTSFSITWSNGSPASSIHYAAGVFEGVDQSNPVNSSSGAASANGSPNPLTTTLNVVSGGYSIAVASHGSGSDALVWNNGWSTQVNQTDGGATSGVGDHAETADATITVSVTENNSNSNRFVLAALSLNPSTSVDNIPPSPPVIQ